ncbi:MAG: thiamine pyrophosphate-dependent enzyme [Chloroflexota bacterium]
MQKLDRRKAVSMLLQERGELLVVAGLGSAAYDVAAVDNCAADFPSWGAMGGTVMIGLGLALAQPERNVLVLTGDGDMLMGMGSLATVALQKPKNLRIVVLDNEQFGETGNQATHTESVADLATIAQGCGIYNAYTITNEGELATLAKAIHSHHGPLFAVLKISDAEAPRVLPPRDGAFLVQRFRTALLGEEESVSA